MVYEQFGNLLNKYLQQADRRAAWLAARLSVSPAAVNRWVNGENRPKPELITRIADVLRPYGAKRQDLLIAAGYAVKESDEHNMQSTPPKTPSGSDASPPHQPNPGPESSDPKSKVGILVQGDLVKPGIVIGDAGKDNIFTIPMTIIEGELQALKKQLTSEHSDAATRAKAAVELGELHDPRAVSTMSDCLTEDANPDPEVRYWLAYALGQIGKSYAIAALEEAAKQEKHMRVRQGIIDGLKKAGRLTNLPSLIAD